MAQNRNHPSTIGIIDLHDVLFFTRVVQSGSFTRAAKLLAVPLSTVSRRVLTLEETLGVRLLYRTTRRVSPTDAGAAFYERAVRSVDDLLDSASSVVERDATVRGALRISAPVEFGVSFLGKVVSRLLEENPALRVRLMLTGRPVDIIGEGFDVAFRFRPSLEGGEPAYVIKRLGEAWLSAVATPAFVKKHAIKHPRDLARCPCLTHGMTEEWTNWPFVDQAGATTVVKVEGRLWCNDFNVLRNAALAGLGVAIAPVPVVAADVARGALVPVPRGFFLPPTLLTAAYPTARHLSPKVRRLLDLVAEEVASAPWREPPAAAKSRRRAERRT